MYLEDNDTSNLRELTPITSNQHVKKVLQNSATTTVDSFVNVSLKILIEQQAAMSSSNDKLTNTFCYKLTNLTAIPKHNANSEKTSRGSSSTSGRNSL